MWHVVQSHGQQNMAVAFLLSQFRDTNIKDLDLGECGDEISESVSLDKVENHPRPYSNCSITTRVLINAYHQFSGKIIIYFRPIINA